MAALSPTHNEQSSSRLISFSDGVVAIAITLLVLPLVDIRLPDATQDPEAATNPLGFIWSQNSSLISSFVVSWLVIFVFWLAHHRVFSDIPRINGPIVRFNALWLMAIVVLPFPTSLLGQGAEPARQTIAFYIGTMLVISLCLTLITREARRHPELTSDKPETTSALGNPRTWGFSAYLALMFVVAIVFGEPAMYGLLGLALVGPASEWLHKRQLARQGLNR